MKIIKVSEKILTFLLCLYLLNYILKENIYFFLTTIIFMVILYLYENVVFYISFLVVGLIASLKLDRNYIFYVMAFILFIKYIKKSMEGENEKRA